MDDPMGGGGGGEWSGIQLNRHAANVTKHQSAESKRRRGISICRSISHDSQGRKEKARVAE